LGGFDVHVEVGGDFFPGTKARQGWRVPFCGGNPIRA
jgi:hypothetical protein